MNQARGGMPPNRPGRFPGRPDYGVNAYPGNYGSKIYQ